MLGDFNLNYAKINDVDYSHVRYFDDFDDTLNDENLVQIIEFPTWSRVINNSLVESTIDHIYVKDPMIVEEIHSIKPIFGDHLLISITVGWGGGAKVESINRDWRKYF